MNQRSMAKCVMMLLAMTLALTLTGCSASRNAKDQPVQPSSVLQQINGDDPALAGTGAQLINSAEELMATNSKELVKLNVNFDTQSLVVISLGEQKTSGYWVWISGVQKQGSELWVQGTANRPDPTSSVTQALSYPYAAVVIEKSDAQQVHPEIESVVGQPLPTTPTATDPQPDAKAAEPAGSAK